MKLNKDESETLKQLVNTNIANLNTLINKHVTANDNFQSAKEVRLLMSEAREQMNLLLTAETEEEAEEGEMDALNASMLFQLYRSKKKIDKEFIQLLFNRFSSDDLGMFLKEIEWILKGRE